MGHLIKVEWFGQGNDLEGSEEFSAPGWEGIWQAVEGEMDRTGRTPSGTEGWNEGGCVLGPEHECDGETGVCRENLKEAVRDWIRSELDGNDLKTGSFHFAGPDWSAITYGWDGE